MHLCEIVYNMYAIVNFLNGLHFINYQLYIWELDCSFIRIFKHSYRLAVLCTQWHIFLNFLHLSIVYDTRLVRGKLDTFVVPPLPCFMMLTEAPRALNALSRTFCCTMYVKNIHLFFPPLLLAFTSTFAY